MKDLEGLPAPLNTVETTGVPGTADASPQSRASILAQATDQAAAVPQVQSGESPAPVDKPLSAVEWKRKWLAECLADLKAVDPKNAEQQVEHGLVTSIVVFMDAAGTATPKGPGKKDLRVPAGFQLFWHNQSYYKFRVGEFPEYDELIEFRTRRGKWAEARPWSNPDPRALEEWRNSEPQFPQGLVQRAIDRTEEAAALIQ